jgi:hypothetical protein
LKGLKLMKKVTVHTRRLTPVSKVYEGKNQIGQLKSVKNMAEQQKEFSLQLDWHGKAYQALETKNNLDRRNWTLHKQKEQAGTLSVPSRPSALGNPDYEPSQLLIHGSTLTLNEGEKGRHLTLMNEQSEKTAELKKKGFGKVEATLYPEEDEPLFLLALYIAFKL